jgi:hypothetical protein
MYDEGLELGVESSFFTSFLVIQTRYVVSGGASRGRKTKAQEMSDAIAGVTEKPALYRFAMSVGRCHAGFLLSFHRQGRILSVDDEVRVAGAGIGTGSLNFLLDADALASD